MTGALDLAEAYSLMLRICGVGIAIDALERLVSASHYQESGPFAWTVLRQRWAYFPARARWLSDQLFRGSGRLTAVLLLRIASVAVIFLYPLFSPWFSFALTALVVTHVYLGFRTAGFGTIGSDPITLVICGASWLTTVAVSNPTTMRAGLWFVAAQSCLAYAIAGIAKLKAPKWRSGEAIVAILSTHIYGNRKLHALVRSRPRLARILCWSAMLWETAFPAALFVPDSLFLPLLVMGVLFHASLAALLGLNLFLFAFPATYVAIWAVRG